MSSEVSQAELARVRDWAKHQLADGREQPWSGFLLRRLGETLDALLAGMAATQAQASPQAGRCQAPPRLVVCNAPRDDSRGSRGPLHPRAWDRPASVAKSKPPVTEPAI